MSESYVQPPPDNASGPKLATVAKTIVASSTDGDKHHYALISGRHTKIIDYTLTRSTDITAYASGDALTATSSGGSITGHSYASIARSNGGSGAIVAALCANSANEATKPSFELWLFGGNTQTTANSDNATFTPTDAAVLQILGVITFTTDAWFSGTSGSSGSCVGVGTIKGQAGRILFSCGTCGDDIWGLTVMRNAYTPIVSEVFTFRLFVEQD